jgi:hypothetical protein
MTVNGIQRELDSDYGEHSLIKAIGMRGTNDNGHATGGGTSDDGDCGCGAPPERAARHSRRSLLTKGAMGAAAAWAAPTLLSSPASAGPGSCTPLVLDWDNFALGSVFSATTISGITVTLTVAALPGTTLAPTNRTIVAGPSGGIAGRALFFGQNSNANNVGQTVTFSFSSPVENISFTVTDMDNVTNGWADRLRINTAGYTFAFAGTTLMTGVGSVADPFRNTNNNLNLANTDARGNVTITYAGPISSFSFQYYNASATGTSQLIRVTDITFESC